MTTELKNKIKAELHKAFTHCGETDANILNDKVEAELDTLMCLMAGVDPEVVHTDVGDLTGYLVDIAVASKNGRDVVALQMIVTRDDLRYIINSYTMVKPEGWTPDDDLVIENECNRVVTLNDVDAAMFNS
jgi:hypothetical protein